MKLVGRFINGEFYGETFKNKKEFEWCVDQIGGNWSCCVPELILVKNKAPKYVIKYAEENDIIIRKEA